jgi:ubiquinone/menaquinone biosynthesis C-methylase UbiE
MSSSKKPTLENDFERMIPEFHKGSIIYGEHIVRYDSAATVVKDLVVLDIASGSGYGTQIIAKNAKKVYGVDVSEESIAYAKEYFGAPNIEYLVGGGEQIPLEDNSVDVVVSFETIEHIKDYEQFMAEVNRVLKPDGLLVLSTPNDLEFAEGNHFHLHEFTYEELKKLTEKFFKNNKSYFQGTWIYSALLDKKSISTAGEINAETYNHAPLKPENYLYFFLLCSNREITESVQNVASIAEHWSARQLQEKQKLTDQHVQNFKGMYDDAKQYSDQQQRLIDAKQTHIENLEAELDQIKNSKLWKTQAKARSIKSKIKRS